MTAPIAVPRAAECAAVVISNESVNPEYRWLVLECDEPATVAQPGQFFQLLCPATDTAPFLRRPMSIYRADPANRRVEFLYKVTGLGTRGLATLRLGDIADIFGPLGHGFHLDSTDRHIAIVGRGVGLATLAPVALEARARGMRVSAVLSARASDLILSEAVLAGAGVETIIVTDESGSSAVENVEQLLRTLVSDAGVNAFYTCGSNRLMLAVQRVVAECGVRGQVALEQQMACGLGMCYCCVRELRSLKGIAYRRVCWDGPVFDIAEALTW